MISETNYRKQISGENSGTLSGIMRCVYRVLSAPYGLIMMLRNVAYDVGISRSTRIPVPVIAVGNLTTGGTGKTPIVVTVVRALQQQGLRPGIVSRGYRADASGENDEKRVLDLLCPHVPHEQNPNRVAASAKLIASDDVDVIVLDDAFQHRRIARNLNVVLIDATNPFGYGYQLPRGLLREPISSLNRADLVLITRTDNVTAAVLQKIEAIVRQHNSRLADRIYRVQFRPSGLIAGSGEEAQTTEIVRNQPVTIMTAIGNPEAFVATCQQIDAKVMATRFFPDHHHYTREHLDDVQELARTAGSPLILTTLKDMVKIPDSYRNIFAVQIETVFQPANDEPKFRDELVRATTIQ
ncbi:MAG: tetraacyldisaccharide 4'-kinase [Fuerstiella sp.]|nr:tetraacyldisaccharide 4'-kinase [Fuerstiella sp.]MCP4510963.1 tetraacyldisaccharide 4'-kinase [Fuerstiella sp.]MCP4852871.1 tetraacyldisaccharide 4'-kinase [Fuerstiella sp.]